MWDYVDSVGELTIGGTEDLVPGPTARLRAASKSLVERSGCNADRRAAPPMSTLFFATLPMRCATGQIAGSLEPKPSLNDAWISVPSEDE